MMSKFWMAAATAALVLPVAAPVSAQSSGDYTHGQWTISPNKNFCTAANVALIKSGTLLMAITGDGDNDGGLFVTVPESTPVKEGRSTVSVIFGDWEPMDVPADGILEGPRGYWLTLGTTEILPKLPDDFRFAVAKDGTTLFDGTLVDFQSFVTEVNACDARMTAK